MREPSARGQQLPGPCGRQAAASFVFCRSKGINREIKEKVGEAKKDAERDEQDDFLLRVAKHLHGMASPHHDTQGPGPGWAELA